MIKKLSIFLILFNCFFNYSKAVDGMLEADSNKAQEQQQVSKDGEQESKRRKAMLFLKNHKKKIGTAIAIAIILYWWGKNPPPPPPPPPSPAARTTSGSSRWSRPGYLADAGWRDIFMYHYHAHVFEIINSDIAYRLRIASWKTRRLTYMLIYHPGLLMQEIRRLYRYPEHVDLN